MNSGPWVEMSMGPDFPYVIRRMTDVEYLKQPISATQTPYSVPQSTDEYVPDGPPGHRECRR